MDMAHEIHQTKRVACREAYLIDFDPAGGLKKGDEPF
jgi:hypothetical protein